MEEIFEYEGQEFTLAEVEQAASTKGLSVDDYTKQYNISRKEGKITPPQEEQGVAAEEIVAPETQPSVTELQQEDISLDSQEISIEEKRKLPYAVSQSLIRDKKEFTIQNVDKALLDFEKAKNIPIAERIVDESGIQKFKTISYNLFGEDGAGGEFGPSVKSRYQAATTAVLGAMQALYTTPSAGVGVAGAVPSIVRATQPDYEALVDKQKESYKELLKTKELIKPMPSITDGEGSSLLDVAGSLVGSAAEVGISVVPTVLASTAATVLAGPVMGATVGATISGADIMGQFVTDYNIEKAKTLYKDLPEEEAIQKLINDGKNEFYAPAMASVPAIALEYAGIKGITKWLSSNPATAKGLGNLLTVSNKEAWTETAQQLPEYFNTAKAKGYSFDDAVKEAIEFSKENAFNTYTNAFFGTLAFGGLGKGAKIVAKKVWEPLKNMRVAIDEGKMEAKIDEIAELQYKKGEAKTIDLKEAIEEQIKTKQQELDGLITKAASIFNFAEDKDFNEINDIENLKKQYISKVKDINNKRDEMPIEEYQEALEIYKNKYLEAQNRIKGVVSNISSKSNESAQKVQKIYDEKGINGAAEIIELYRPMAEKIAMKRKNVPGFDKELLTDEILTGERGVLDLIRSFKPEKNQGVPLPAYINKFINSRAIEASQRVLKQDFELDVTEAKGIAEETTAETRVEVQEEAQQEIRKALAEDLKLDDKTQNDIVAAVEKTLGTKLPSVTDKKFKQALTTGFRNELTNTFKQIFGRTESYEQFLRDNFEKIYPAIPQSAINKSFKEFNEPVLDPKTGKQLRERTAEGKKVFQKRNITKAEFLKYFLDAPGNVKGARKTSLASTLASEIGLDNVLNSLAKPEIVEKFKAIQEIQGQEVPSNFIEIISKNIDRAINYLDNLQKNNGELYVSLGFPELSIAIAKAFLKAIKAAFKGGQSFAEALQKGIDAAKKLLDNEQDRNAVEEAAKETFKETKDFTSKEKNEEFVEKIDGVIVKNKIFNILNDSIVSLKENIKNTKNIEEKEQAIYEFLKYELAGLVKINTGTKTNKKYLFKDDSVAVEHAWEWFKKQNVLDTETLKSFKLIKTGKGKSLFYKNIAINDFKGKYRPSSGSIVIKNSWQSVYDKLTNQKEAQDIMNEANASYVAKKIAKLVIENKLELAEDYLKTSGLSSDSAFRLSGKIRSIQKAKKGEKLVYEHTPPILEIRENILNVIDPKKSFQENYKNVLAELNKSKIDFVTETTTKKIDELGRKTTGVFSSRFEGVIDIEKDLAYINTATDSKKIRIFDFDDTLAESKSNVLYTMPDGKKGKLNAEQFAKQGDDLAKQGANFDFSEFAKVIDGEKGPLFGVAKKIIDARGSENIYILTARPENAKYAIKQFLDALGLPFNIDNIIGLGNGAPQAKADWIKNKVKEGFNDVYFADDAVKNVQAVKDALKDEDIKSRVQQAKKPAKSLDRQFNEDILQKSTKVDWYKEYSPVKAELLGRKKGKGKFFIPYSADDFVGLLYTTLGKSKIGDAQLQWYNENLLRPFSRGIQQYEAAKQKAMREWVNLKKQIKKDIPAGLNKQNETGFRNQDSVRIYIWHTQGVDMTSKENGLAKADLNENLKYVRNNPKLKSFADRLMALNPEGYPDPSKNWNVGDITTDLISYINDVKRKEFLQEWKDNSDIIFSDKNKNKLKALYGEKYIEALDDMLYRMWNGRNRRIGVSKLERGFQDWVNNSVGTIMFFNSRSALLQTISAVNFINFTDNNPINAAVAFANQKQYWSDFTELFNSDFLKQRRTGLQTDINADEIANAAATSTNKAKAALSAILKFGFTPTQIADSFAIASGGASFYRNRIKKYLKEGLSQEEAKKKSFSDFQEVAEESQQSARPDRISMQQASSLGRIILAFGNTPMQYARLTKKAALDLINNRGDWKTNISKIMYYSVIQNIIFSALQQGLFALLFSDEEDDEEKSRYFRIANSSIDTFLRGAGVYGAGAATVKNMILKVIEESEKSRPDYTKVAIEATAISPPINSKLRKLVSAGKTFTYKQSKEKVFTEGFSLENPAFLAVGQVISAGTNLPADRLITKADHIYTAIQPETELWQSIALSLGWSEWDLGMIENQTKKPKKKMPSKISTKRSSVKSSGIKRAPVRRN